MQLEFLWLNFGGCENVDAYTRAISQNYGLRTWLCFFFFEHQNSFFQKPFTLFFVVKDFYPE